MAAVPAVPPAGWGDQDSAMRERGPKVGSFVHHFSLLIISVCILFILLTKRKKRGQTTSGPDIIHLIFEPGKCSAFARCISCFFCRVVLDPLTSALEALLACVSLYSLCVPMPHICHCPFSDIYVLQLCCPTECIASCGWFCCYKTCNPHSVACWAVLEHLCLVPRQGNTNFIPCICLQLQRTCALATVQCNLRKSTFCFANATSHDHESHFLSVSWHSPNESFLIAKANFPHNLKKTPTSSDSVFPDFQPSFCSRVKINFNSFVLWESVAFFPLK